ncbi:MAG: hypothetical protein AAF519_19180 [Bacteroidota bacterium]
MKEITELIDAVLNHATHFLKEHGEFYPFAIIRKTDGTLQPFNIYEGEEYPSPTELLKQLKKVLDEGFDQYGYDSFAIGINVTVTRDGEKKDAIQIKLNHKKEYYEDSFVPYDVVGDSVELFDLYTENS